jgi:hypothetical protein
MPMYSRLRRVVPLAIALIVAASASVALGSASRGGPLAGTWTGSIVGNPGSALKPVHIRIVVNAAETAGRWRISASCRGPLTLDSISGGYHHYLRKLARGATCAGGDIDCLKRAGANLYDSVTSHLGGEYDSAGTLRRTSV